MKISEIKSAVLKTVSNLKIEQKENEIAKYLKIDTGAINEPIYEAREIIANYAKANGIRVYIQKAPKAAYSPASVYTRERLCVSVEKPATKKSGAKMISALIPDDVKAIFHNQKLNEKTRRVSTFEDNFIRNLYRNIEVMVNSIK